MDVVGLHHVNINVRELAPAIAFYVEQLGFTLLPRPDFDFAGAWIGMGAHELHLVVAPEAAIDPRQHFALQVLDADAAIAHLDAHGITHRVSRGAGGACQVFLKDPSGNRIELQQLPAR